MSDIPDAQELIEQPEQQQTFRLGTVVELFSNSTAKVKFDGEETASEKQYAYLKSYKPSVNDRVLLAAVGGTYVILGSVIFDESPDNEQSNVFSTITVEGDATIGGYTTIGGTLRLNGPWLGFFGASPRSLVTVRETGRTTEQIVADIVWGLEQYGLINVS